jgi:two-component system nitrogen regulation response regulator GlnG
MVCMGGPPAAGRMNRILVIDDDQATCRLLGAIFRAEGFDVLTAHDGPSGIATVLTERPDVVLLDLDMPAMDGMAVLERLKTEAPAVPVVMLTGSLDVKNAVRAIQLGAFNYLTKPMNRAEVVIVVRRAQETSAMRIELEELRRQAGRLATETLASQMGSSAAIQRVIEQVNLVAGTPFTVLVLGETGTGKELVSQALHRLSDRRSRPFVALDCGAIPDALLESELFGHEKGAFTGADRRKEGRFRLAEGGTCFLDEIGNLPLNLQAKLLRVLESGQLQSVGADRSTPMDVRFLAASNLDLHDRVEQGAFRSDLYFRLAQYAIRLPPLRERPEDIPFLTRRFVDEASTDLRRPIEAIVPDTLSVLTGYGWPGNVRELRNVVRQAVLQTRGLVLEAGVVRSVIGETKRASPPDTIQPAGASLREIGTTAAAGAERRAICDALRAVSGNKSAAARALKTDYKTLHVKIKTLRIHPRDWDPNRAPA